MVLIFSCTNFKIKPEFEGEAWVIGAMFGGARVGIVNFDKSTCPYRLKSQWRHSVRGKLEKDPGITMVCAKPVINPNDDLHSSPSIRDSVTAAPPPPVREDFIPSDNLEKLKAQLSKVPTTSTEGASSTVLTVTPVADVVTTSPTNEFETVDKEKENASLETPVVENTPCDCPRIVISSQNPNTIEKHGNQLGPYR